MDQLRDSRLFVLGKMLEEIQKQLGPIREEHDRLGLEAADYAKSQTGYEPGGRNSPGLAEDYFAASSEMAARNGFNTCDEKLQALHCKLSPIMYEIMRTPANSTAGLGVKALAAIEANSSLWDVPAPDLDYDQESVRSLIEAACAVAGIPIPCELVATPAALTGQAFEPSHRGSAALN